MVTAWQLPGRVADSVATLPDSMARLALRSHARCSKWARLAGIPALAGCNLSADTGNNGGGASGDSCGSPVAETPHCLQSPRGGGENATPEGHNAALVYEEAAAASLATSLIATRLAGSGSLDGSVGSGSSSSSSSGGSGDAQPVELTFHCLRHVITAELPEDPEVVEIVKVSSGLVIVSSKLVICRAAVQLGSSEPCTHQPALHLHRDTPCMECARSHDSPAAARREDDGEQMAPASYPDCLRTPSIAALREADGRKDGCCGGPQRNRTGWPLLHVRNGRLCFPFVLEWHAALVPVGSDAQIWMAASPREDYTEWRCPCCPAAACVNCRSIVWQAVGVRCRLQLCKRYSTPTTAAAVCGRERATLATLCAT